MDKKKIIIVVGIIALICVGVGVGVGLSNRNVDELVSNDNVVEESSVAGSTEEVTTAVTDESVDSSVESTTEEETTTEDVTDIETEDEANKYYMKVNPDGSREYSPQLVTDVMGNEWFSGYSEDEVIFFLDHYLLEKYDTTDESIRDSLSDITERDVEHIMKKLPKNQSTTSTASNTKTESSSSNTKTENSNTQSNTNTSNNNSNTQPSTPSSQETTPSQPSNQQQTVNEWGLTQEQMDAIKAENEAAGIHAGGDPVNVGEDTGEHFGGRQFN